MNDPVVFADNVLPLPLPINEYVDVLIVLPLPLIILEKQDVLAHILFKHPLVMVLKQAPCDKLQIPLIIEP